MKLKLREIEIFGCGQLQPVDNHQSTPLGGFAPTGSLRSPQSATRSSHPVSPIKECAYGAYTARCQAARTTSSPVRSSTPTVRASRNSSLLSNESTWQGRGTTERSSPRKGRLRLIGRSSDAPIRTPQWVGEGENTHAIRAPVCGP